VVSWLIGTSLYSKDLEVFRLGSPMTCVDTCPHGIHRCAVRIKGERALDRHTNRVSCSASIGGGAQVSRARYWGAACKTKD
jgi:hypothetical protein